MTVALVSFDFDQFDRWFAAQKRLTAQANAALGRIAVYIDEEPFTPQKETPVPITGRRESPHQ